MNCHPQAWSKHQNWTFLRNYMPDTGLFNSLCSASDNLPAWQFWTFINWTNSGQLSVANLVDHSLREGICKVVQLAVKSVGLWVHVSREERASGGVSSIISTALPLHSWQTGGLAPTGNATPSSLTVSCWDARQFFQTLHCISRIVFALLNRSRNVAFSICQNQRGLALWHNISWWEVSLFMKLKQLPLERWQRLVSFKNMRILIAAVKTQPTWTMPFNLY